jgi:hypothetical protein
MAQRVQSRSKPPQTPRNEACADEKSFSDPSNQASPVQEATTDTSLVRSIWSGQVRSWYVHAFKDDVRTQSWKETRFVPADRRIVVHRSRLRTRNVSEQVVRLCLCRMYRFGT